MRVGHEEVRSMMMRINLLPHREEKRRARPVAILAGLAAFLGLAVAGLYGLFLISRKQIRRNRNKWNDEITKLEKQIREIKNS